MSHIILEENFEEVLEKLKNYEIFVNEKEAAILVELGEFVLPFIFAETKDGVVIKAANGSQHIDQEPIQEEMVRIISKFGFKIRRGVISRKILKKYGLLNS